GYCSRSTACSTLLRNAATCAHMNKPLTNNPADAALISLVLDVRGLTAMLRISPATISSMRSRNPEKLPVPFLSRPLLWRREAVAQSIACTTPKDDDAVGFLHSVLCSVGLPRRNIAERSFQRTSGKASLLIEAGRLWNGREWITQPVPYGPIPRMIAGLDLHA